MTHPVLAAAASCASALKSVADANPTFMSPADKAAALVELARVEAQVAELRLRVIADAGDHAGASAHRDAAAWVHHHTRARFEDTRADLRLAVALDRRYGVLAAALREGAANLAQARVIASALDDLPREIPADIVVKAEETLVGHCADLDPRQLHRLGRRIVDVVAPDIAEATEARRLADLEADAHRRTRLTLRRCGDGTTRISGLLPDLAATRLATYLEAFTNPRKHPDGISAADGTGDSADPWFQLPYPRRLGQAFCQLLETLDPRRLPLHAGDATTVNVTIDYESLVKDLGVAEVLGGEAITASEARRLACTAQIIPAVLGSNSEVLDLGRSQRLFTAAQRKALMLNQPTCRAEGCTIPARWCEAHHQQPWSHGGRTASTRPTSTAATTTTEPTTPPTSPNASPTATSASPGGREGCQLSAAASPTPAGEPSGQHRRRPDRGTPRPCGATPSTAGPRTSRGAPRAAPRAGRAVPGPRP